MKKAHYICIEGTEGVGKTTQTKQLVEHLRAQGYKVLETKEPGTPHAALTMTLRGIMLDKQYDEQLTMAAREFISQAIRSIHIEKVIIPAIEEYDFIVQDRGILSGLAYGTGCGNDEAMIRQLSQYVLKTAFNLKDMPEVGNLYHTVVYLTGSISAGLNRALASKKEFAAGDAMEAKGTGFLSDVSGNMKRMAQEFYTTEISVDGKSKEEVFAEILSALNLKE